MVDNSFSEIRQSWIFQREKADKVIFLDEDDHAHFAYLVTFFADNTKSNQPTRPLYFIDPLTQKVIKKIESLRHNVETVEKGSGPGGNYKAGRYDY